VVVCEVGLKSAHLAETMRAGGLAAFQLRGGIRRLMALSSGEEERAAMLLAPAVRD
jgi:hypothetical protein